MGYGVFVVNEKDRRMDSRIYDLEVKCKDGTWMIWETAEGLDDANNIMSSERWAMACGDIPWAEIRKTRRIDPPKVGAKVFFKPRQPDALQGFSSPAEAVGEVVKAGRDKSGPYIVVKAKHLLEETIRVKDFHKKGVRESLLTKGVL